MILLATDVVVYLFLEGLLLALLTVALFNSVKILMRWDFASTSPAQYNLEKRAYLVGLIILVALLVKILLLPFFTRTVDALAAVVPGAMCAAGVIAANEYGLFLLVMKVAVVFAAGLWLLAHRQDQRAENHPHLVAKFRFFLLLYVLLLAESLLDWLYFSNISTLTPVQCCSLIYGVAGPSNPLPLGWDTSTLLLLFYLLFALVLAAGFMRSSLLHALASVAFLYVSYYAVVYFFGTYVYQLPTHRCPFCMLQGSYRGAGYLIWGALLAGTFFAVARFVLQQMLGRPLPKIRGWAVALHSLFVLTCSLWVGVYFLKNGVLLQ